MSGIDKMYFESFEQWEQFYNWCKSHELKIKKKTKENIFDGFYYTDSEEVKEIVENSRNNEIERIENFKRILNLDKNHPEFIDMFRSWVYKDTITYDLQYLEEIEELVDNYNETGEVYFNILGTNFSSKIDYYLIQNCHLDFIQDRLKEQYKSQYKKIKRNSIFFRINCFIFKISGFYLNF